MKILEVRGGLLPGRRRKIRELAEKIKVEGDEIIIPGVETAEFGRFTAFSRVLFGSKMLNEPFTPYSSGIVYTTSRRFQKERESELLMTERPYRLEIEVDGSGRIELPGYRLKDGTLLLYILPSYSFSVPELVSLPVDDGLVQAELRAGKVGISGRVDILANPSDVRLILSAGRLCKRFSLLGKGVG